MLQLFDVLVCVTGLFTVCMNVSIDTERQIQDRNVSLFD